jgi:hypothetical protein
VITIQRHGSEDVRPVLRCTVCKKALPLAQAWVMFPALASGKTSAEGKFTHRTCADGNGIALVQSQTFMLWRGVDLFSRLMRQ